MSSEIINGINQQCNWKRKQKNEVTFIVVVDDEGQEQDGATNQSVRQRRINQIMNEGQGDARH
jgi:hypothetical protein